MITNLTRRLATSFVLVAVLAALALPAAAQFSVRREPVSTDSYLKSNRADTTDGVVDGVELTHSSSDNNPTAGDGVGISFKLENDANTIEEWAVLECLSTDISDGAEYGDCLFKVMWGGTVEEAFRFDSSATSFTVPADVTVAAESTNGNAGVRNQFIGVPRIKLKSLGTGTNGSTETTSYVDDSPTGEYAPVDASVTEAEGSVDGVYRFGASSYAATFLATAVEDDGFKRTITGDDLEANESIGLWLYSTVAIASGDLQVLLTDDGGAQKFSIGAIPAAAWTWLEVDISALTGGTGDVVSEFGITMTAQGEAAALGEFVLYLDQAYKWDADDEEALGAAIQYDGVLSVAAVLTANTGANTTSDLVEGTDFVVHYETGNDFLVWISDQSSNSTIALLAY